MAGFTGGDAIDQKLSDSGVEMNSSEATKQTMEAGLGLGVVSLHTLDHELRVGRLSIIEAEGFPIPRSWYRVQQRDKLLSHLTKLFRRFVLQQASLMADGESHSGIFNIPLTQGLTPFWESFLPPPNGLTQHIRMLALPRLKLTSNQLILFTALWMTLLGNLSYFRRVLDIYPPDRAHAGFLLSVVALQLALTLLLLGLIAWRPLLKPVLILLQLAASLAAYFMDSYGIVIDRDMIRNTLQTNAAEAGDLISWSLLGYLLILGVLPGLLLWRTELPAVAPVRAWLRRGRMLLLTLLAVAAILLLFYKPYSSFFREHKTVRYYSNPLYFVYSGLRYAGESLLDRKRPFTTLGLDARLAVDRGAPRLVVVVVGETARADHFSLNGYDKNTNPRLSRVKDLINFPRFTACGTSTALSVPCMFSSLTRERFSHAVARRSDNVLDILQRAGVAVLWLDNNSSSKGVADRVAYRDFRTPANNPLCDLECRDAGMLEALPPFIESQQGRDIVIVLHQMGNHGPAYYKRYPPEFETFTPVCKTNELDQCDNQAISNAYDNAILYTDDFLARTIELLKSYDDRYATALWYISDHGESLGEQGIYLHGLPYFLAPEAQTRVPSILWLGRQIPETARQAARAQRLKPLSHDNLFDSLLGLFGVETAILKPERNLFDARNATVSEEKP